MLDNLLTAIWKLITGMQHKDPLTNEKATILFVTVFVLAIAFIFASVFT